MSLVSEVQLQIDEGGGPVFWTAAQIYDSINQAIVDLQLDLRYELTSATITVNPGDDVVAFPTSTIMLPQYVMKDNLKLFITTHPMLQDWSVNWFNEPQAQPRWIVLWDASHLRFWPPANSTYTFIIYGQPWPTLIDANTTDITGLDPLLRRAIVLWASALLLEETQPTLADAHQAEAIRLEKRYQRTLRNRQGDNIDRLRPGTGWSIGMFGDIGIGRKYN